MALVDLFPFKGVPADAYWEHEVAPSADTHRRVPRTNVAPSGFEGHSAKFRLAFRAMEVPGFPDNLEIGGAEIAQGPGPLWTRVTRITQKPGWRVVYEKQMEHGVVAVADNDWITLCQLNVTVPIDLTNAMVAWRDEGLAAVGVLAALLDERVAQEAILEDLLVFNAPGDEVIGVVDHVQRVRRFQPANRVLSEHRGVLDRLGGLDLTSENATLASSRWYLRAAQLGPTPDAIVFLWIAAEALAKPRYGAKLTAEEGRRTDVKWVELAVAEAGLPPHLIDPPIGRLADLRAAVVHGGLEDHPLLSPGYYALEAIVRLLIRHRLGTGPFGWPVQPGVSNLVAPLAWITRVIPPKTTWKAPIWRNPS